MRVEGEYGTGDHMYKLDAIDDLWGGTWGIIRSHQTHKQAGLMFALPENSRAPQPVINSDRVREYWVDAVSTEIRYNFNETDPLGMKYVVRRHRHPDGKVDEIPHDSPIHESPMVLRALQGELIKVHLTNLLDIPCFTRPQNVFPETPLELSTDCGQPVGERENLPRITFDGDIECFDRSIMEHRNLSRFRLNEENCPNRIVSQAVSLHCDLLSYNIKESGGVNVGQKSPPRSPEQFVRPRQTRMYTFLADKAYGPCPCRDHADVRNHRHHGLIAAIIVYLADAKVCEWVGPRSGTQEPYGALLRGVPGLLPGQCPAVGGGSDRPRPQSSRWHQCGL